MDKFVLYKFVLYKIIFTNTYRNTWYKYLWYKIASFVSMIAQEDILVLRILSTKIAELPILIF